MQPIRYFAAVVCVLVAAACGEPSAPAARNPSTGNASRSVVAAVHPRVFGQQAAFLQIADSLPGFAGVFVGSDGHPHVAITASGDAAAAVAAVNRRWPEGIAGEAVTQDKTVSARYDYRQLYDWKEALEGEIGDKAYGYGVHVTTNQVDVYSPNSVADAEVERQAEASGIPAEAVHILRGGNGPDLYASKYLYDDFRPGVPGGVGIWRQWYNGGWNYEDCTIGINAKMALDPTPWVVLTASHCTASLGGGGDGTRIYQGGVTPTHDSSYIMGSEIADPNWSTSGCDTGYTHCRAADVAEIGYYSTNPEADSGYIAVTISRNSYSLVWYSKDSTSLPVMGTWGDQPWEGLSLDHVGITTGWHSGTVTDACIDVSVPPHNGITYPGYEWQCQTVVQGAFDKGDSGGPVFSHLVGKQIMFAGILSGATDTTWTSYTFSSYPNICVDYDFCPQVDRSWAP